MMSCNKFWMIWQQNEVSNIRILPSINALLLTLFYLFSLRMSIVIDDDDDLVCTTDNAVETVYSDDAHLRNYIDNELKTHEDMISTGYAKVYEHYDKEVIKLLGKLMRLFEQANLCHFR